jgi:hypothetical protein
MYCTSENTESAWNNFVSDDTHWTGTPIEGVEGDVAHHPASKTPCISTSGFKLNAESGKAKKLWCATGQMECIFEGGPTFKPKEHTVVEAE